MARRTVTFLLAISTTLACAQAQYLNHRDPRTPRTSDGSPNLSAPTPRLNGHPDLSGVWQAERTPISEFTRVLGEGILVQVDLNDVTKHVINVLWDVKPEENPMRPEAAAIMEERMKSEKEFQTKDCLPESLPAANLILDFKMIQTPGEIVAVYENISPARQIYLDGRSLPQDPQPSWMGYSVGRWEGDTLVVETIGITERAWLDAFGHPRSEGMRITERYRRRDFGHIDFEIAFNDPKYYTRQFGFKTTLNLLPDTDILEYICNENR